MTPITFSEWPFNFLSESVTKVAKFQEKTNFFAIFRGVPHNTLALEGGA